MRYTGPKDRLARRVGIDLFGRGSRLTRLNVPPGMHGPRGAKKLSEYGRQLKEKQKIRFLYGLAEKQLAKYLDQAQKSSGSTGEALLKLLETRLDNVVYRLMFAPTRFSARQLVSHNHVLVNGKKVNIASYKVREGETINLDTKAQVIPEVKKTLEQEPILPSWLERRGGVGRIKSLPARQDVQEPISEQDIVEYYSR